MVDDELRAVIVYRLKGDLDEARHELSSLSGFKVAVAMFRHRELQPDGRIDNGASQRTSGSL